MSREDIPRSVHTSLGILLRKGRFAYDLEVFQPGSAENKANISDNFLKLPGGPPWMNSQSVQANYGHQEVKVSKVNVPPVAHFGGSPHLTVFTIHPVTLAGENPIPGSWISVSRLIDEADEQWASVITSIVSQIQYALSVGYISLKSLQKHASRPSSGFRASAAQMNGHTFNQTPSQELPEIDNLHVTSNQENIEAKSREDQHSLGSIEPSIDHHDSFSFMVGDDGNHIGCSDYPRGPHPPLEYESSSHETENDPVIDGSLDSRESVVWNPGNMVRAVSGGRDVQAILDSPGLKLGVVNWHAAWVDSCIDILPFMERLATRFGAVAIIHVDVEASMANKLFAYEKTLTRSESRRKGSKPVVKNGQKFPCITLHEPFNSQPQSYFYGANAIDELALALSKFGNTLNAKPEQPIESQTNNVETQNSQNLSKHSPGCESPENQDQPEIEHPQIPKFQRPAPVPSISEIRPDIAGDESQNKDGNVSSEGSSQRPYQVQILTKGALEFKAILNKAKADKRKLTVLWRLPDGESWQVPSDWPKKVEGNESSVFVSAQVNLNKFNQQLASALAVRSGPFHLQVFEDSKLVEQRNANYLMTTLTKPRERLTESTDIGSQSQNNLPSTTDSESSSHLPSSAYEEDKAENFAAHSAEDKAKSLATKSNQPRDTTYDPPSKGAKTGAKRKLPSGVSTYWSKMPCLQCGCPWWLGEDWEARCARCSWTAETDGYDDDSQPLPKFKADYDKFIALVKEGRTADWHDGKGA